MQWRQVAEGGEPQFHAAQRAQQGALRLCRRLQPQPQPDLREPGRGQQGVMGWVYIGVGFFTSIAQGSLRSTGWLAIMQCGASPCREPQAATRGRGCRMSAAGAPRPASLPAAQHWPAQPACGSRAAAARAAGRTTSLQAAKGLAAGRGEWALSRAACAGLPWLKQLS